MIAIVLKLSSGILEQNTGCTVAEVMYFLGLKLSLYSWNNLLLLNFFLKCKITKNDYRGLLCCYGSSQLPNIHVCDQLFTIVQP